MYMLLYLLVCSTIGACIGLFISKYLDGPISLTQLALMLLFSVLAVPLHIAVHEAGHLVAGLASGYSFVSYRIFSWMWIKQDDKLVFARYNIPGTGGQCLMAPPAFSPKNFPYLLYNLGGGLANLLLAFLVFCLALLGWLPVYASLPLILIGIFLGLTNLIPFKSTISNDGYNILSIARDPESLFYWWSILQIHADTAKGTSLAHMPQNYFQAPPLEKLDNPIFLSGAVNYYNHLIAVDRLIEAKDYLRQVLESEQALLPLFKLILTCEYLCLQLLFDEDLDKELTKADWKLVASLNKAQLSTLRFSYAYTRWVEGDEKKADTYLVAFDKLALNYPYPSEVQIERGLLEQLKDKNLKDRHL